MNNQENRSLSDRELATLKEFVENTLRKSGSLLKEWFGKSKTDIKFDEDLVTQAENLAWELVSTKIKGSFEGHVFLRELNREDLDEDTPHRFIWIVDSLDGVASFQAGMPVWGSSIALFEKFWPVLAWLYLPVTDELYSAYAAREALLNDRPIHCRRNAEIDNESLVLVYSRFHLDFVTDFPGKLRNFGSSAGHMAYVAKGSADACLIKNVNVQDLAAGSIILEAAGGEIRFMNGDRFHVGDYLSGAKVDGPLLAAPKGSHGDFFDHFKLR